MYNMEKAFANYFGTTVKNDVSKIIGEKNGIF